MKFVYFSRIHPVKNLLKLVEIWKSDEFFKELKLYIYGDISDEEYFDKIKKIIFKRENFIYKGPLYKNKIKTLSKYDVLIYPSLSENFGLVVLEALAGGLYLILNKDLPWKTLKTKDLASLIKFEKKNLISSIKIINKNRNTIFSERRKNDIKKMLIKDFRWKKIALKYFEIYNFLLNNSKTF